MSLDYNVITGPYLSYLLCLTQNALEPALSPRKVDLAICSVLLQQILYATEQVLLNTRSHLRILNIQ